MFDIPVEPEESKKEYTKFRKFLLKDGFIMMQYSIYSRFCHNESDCEKHIQRVKRNASKYGNIRILKTTERQYENMIILNGGLTYQENISFKNDMLVIE